MAKKATAVRSKAKADDDKKPDTATDTKNAGSADEAKVGDKDNSNQDQRPSEGGYTGGMKDGSAGSAAANGPPAGASPSVRRPGVTADRLAKMKADQEAEQNGERKPADARMPSFRGAPNTAGGEPSLQECNAQYFAEERARKDETETVAKAVAAAVTGSMADRRRVQKNLR